MLCSMSKACRGRDGGARGRVTYYHWKNSSLGRSGLQTLSGTKSSLSIGKNIQKEVGFPYPAWIFSLGKNKFLTFTLIVSLKKHVCWSTHQNQLQDMQALRNSKLNIQHYFSAFSNAFKREPEKFCLPLTQAPHETTFSRTVLPCLLTTE